MGAIWLLDRHITIGITSRPSDQHMRDLGRQITLHEGGEILPKNQRYISYILPIYHRYFVTRGDFFFKFSIYLPKPIYCRYFGDIYENISPPIFLHKISCQPLPIHDISPIYPDIFLLAYSWSSRLSSLEKKRKPFCLDSLMIRNKRAILLEHEFQFKSNL